MQTPTTDQLETTIEVLSKLAERLNTEAAHSIIQMPNTQLGVHYAGDIWRQTIEQTNRIAALSSQLKNWRDELRMRPGYISFCPPGPVRLAHFKTSVVNLWLWSKNLLAIKWHRRQMG